MQVKKVRKWEEKKRKGKETGTWTVVPLLKGVKGSNKQKGLKANHNFIKVARILKINIIT